MRRLAALCIVNKVLKSLLLASRLRCGLLVALENVIAKGRRSKSAPLCRRITGYRLFNASSAPRNAELI